jgi:hypothetical protein
MDANAFKVMDGMELPERWRGLLRPGEPVTVREGPLHSLPRYFYVVESWEQAKRAHLSPHFRLSELMMVDCREAPELLHEFPHYVPCAVAMLARYLELLRDRVKAPVYVSANGGYRSPAHRLTTAFSPHQWGTAADIYRIGDVYLNTEAAIEKFRRLAGEIGMEVNTLPYGLHEGGTDDHLHFDVGYVYVVPKGQTIGDGGSAS